MKLSWKKGFFLLGFLVMGAVLGQSVSGSAEEVGSKNRVPEGVYIDMTRDFYETLRNEGGAGAKVYSNDPSSEYLKQISISARFMVETNLQILKHQEEMIRLLQSLSDKKTK
ncbi:MAG: hypothetical protein ABII06_08790 [Pseudomonadota bacterium]